MADGDVMVACITVFRDGVQAACVTSHTERHADYIAVRNALREIAGVNRQVIVHNHREVVYELESGTLFPVWRRVK